VSRERLKQRQRRHARRRWERAVLPYVEQRMSQLEAEGRFFYAHAWRGETKAAARMAAPVRS
jgi:hypothetical protein